MQESAKAKIAKWSGVPGRLLGALSTHFEEKMKFFRDLADGKIERNSKEFYAGIAGNGAALEEGHR